MPAAFELHRRSPGECAPLLAHDVCTHQRPRHLLAKTTARRPLANEEDARSTRRTTMMTKRCAA